MIVYSKPIYGLALASARKRLINAEYTRKLPASTSPTRDIADPGRLPLIKRKLEAVRQATKTSQTATHDDRSGRYSQIRHEETRRRPEDSRVVYNDPRRRCSVKPITRRVKSLKAKFRQRELTDELPTPICQAVTQLCLTTDYLSPIASCEHLPYIPPPSVLLHKSVPKTPKLPSKPAMVRLWAFVQEDL